MVKRFRVWAGTLGLLFGVVVDAVAEVEYEYGWQVPRPYIAPDVVAVDDQGYRKECNSCHFAYPPGFLPARSWQALMTGLNHHFGENAELSPEVRARMQKYLEAHAADHSTAIGSLRVMHYMKPDEIPLRLTDTYYIKLRHRNIPARIFSNNPQLKSLSNCNGCHQRADSGYFNEGEVRIPGMEQWEER